MKNPNASAAIRPELISAYVSLSCRMPLAANRADGREQAEIAGRDE